MVRLMVVLGFHEAEQQFGEDVRDYYIELFGDNPDILFYSVKNNSGSVNTNRLAENRVKRELDEIVKEVSPEILYDIHCDPYLMRKEGFSRHNNPKMTVFNHSPKPDYFEELEGDGVTVSEVTPHGWYNIRHALVSDDNVTELMSESWLEGSLYEMAVEQTARFVQKLYDVTL